MTRRESMHRHPSGKRRVEGLVSEARRHLAQDAASRLLVEADAFMGGPVVPESPEVAQERMDRQACALGSVNAPPRPEPKPAPRPQHPVVDAVKAFGGGMALFGGLWGLTVCSSIASEFAGGWPL